MSRWTYIRGMMELGVDPFEHKPMKEPRPDFGKPPRDYTDEEKEARWRWREKFLSKCYLPYPEEQFKIDVPIMLNRYKKPTKKDPSDHEMVLDTRARIFSLPKAKKYLDHAFSLLPQGECGFRYAIKQDELDYSSGVIGTFEYPCLFKYYKDAINKLYTNAHPFYSWNFEELCKYQKLDKECSVDYVTDMIIGISESLRWCSADELREALEKFFSYLKENEFDINNCLLEWRDGYEYNLLHRCVCDGSFEPLVFETIDTGKNKVIYRKTYDYPRDENGYIDYDSPEYDEKHPLVKEEVLGEKPVYPTNDEDEDEEKAEEAQA